MESGAPQAKEDEQITPGVLLTCSSDLAGLGGIDGLASHGYRCCWSRDHMEQRGSRTWYYVLSGFLCGFSFCNFL